MNASPVKVLFDDGTTVDVQAKPRDLVTAERDLGLDVSTAGPMYTMYAVTFAALRRMKRNGLVESELPSTLEAFLDSVDVETQAAEEADPEGKGSAPAPVTG